MTQVSEEEWINLDVYQPENDLPCEYIIEVKCRGWFRPTEAEIRFAADERTPPTTQITKWRLWKDGEPWLEGQKLVREHRNNLEKNNECN